MEAEAGRDDRHSATHFIEQTVLAVTRDREDDGRTGMARRRCCNDLYCGLNAIGIQTRCTTSSSHPATVID
jgi:hypothetical protein